MRDEAMPLGIDQPIVFGKIFPETTRGMTGETKDFWAPPTNYASYAEHPEGAEQLLEKERAKGWMDWHATEQELEQAYGSVTYSRIGVISKIKGSAQKLRLIHDLRRSGINQRVVMKERIILPRVCDVVEDILWVSDQLKPSEEWGVFNIRF